MTDLISLPHYLQSADGLCLAACVRMVLVYWGSAESEEDVAELLGIGLWGVPASAIRRLSRWGWDVDYGRGARVDLTQWLQRGIPIEPRRLWKRYLIGNPLFLWRVLKQRLGLLRFDDV